MKKLAVLFLLIALALGGCSLPPPADAQGESWSEDWVTVGNVVGVDTPEGLMPQENIDTLAVNEIYYATWSIGDSETLQKDEETEATVYDAQVYLLLQGRETVDEAKDDASEWLALAKERYDVKATLSAAYGGQDFTTVIYAYTGEDNPYARGAAAYGVYGNYAISVEVSCRESFSGDVAGILADFLQHCHYAA